MPTLIRRTKPPFTPHIHTWVAHPKYGRCFVDAIAFATHPKPSTFVSMFDANGERKFAPAGELQPAEAPAPIFIRRTRQ